ncbi:MAG: sigma-70 family RNA polymerase sigma factor [Chloroflexi bacterium]|nr:sigma-70 family RNA polymerase sigma factor [Chloroflexota bacterium]MCI0788946.1 sigma-70 family RNA polymerase sigma factor [Chloroflexota bacterium]MCI0801031.1 sigma-70 family RNA polymerase sigma factor [Chloroflexota bacterium]MCI0830311.1 sigma-70 family RNA polymerase sigma factor [Chloroflexota bacterium]MCI0849071.1 sigma-70 family RNA polymerase sigma factor [Chloroflexota bacterium]
MSTQDASGAVDLERQFTEIVEQYSDLAYSVAFRMLRNAEDAEDAVQEAYISAFKALPHFKGQSKLSTWLYRIVVNACLMKIRKEKSRAKYLSENLFDDALVYDWKNDPEEAAVNSELRSTLEAGLDVLSPDLRAAVVLRDIQGLSTDESAEALNISIASLKSRLHRARILLRKRLEDYSSLSLLPTPETQS